LWEITDLSTDLNEAISWLKIASDCLCQRGLAGTITADQPNLVSVGNTEGNFRHQHSGAYAQLKVLDVEHRLFPILWYILAKP
jgi:hypothetical protein